MTKSEDVLSVITIQLFCAAFGFALAGVGGMALGAFIGWLSLTFVPLGRRK